MNYREAITQAMTELGQKDDTFFLGQAVNCYGTFMSPTLDNVPKEKRLEFPVQESFNIQFAIGVALGGLVPVVVIPRINFLLVAFGDIVNLLDKLHEMTEGQVNPHVIIRTAIGPDQPISPKVQHVGDYSYAFIDSLNGIISRTVGNENIDNFGVKVYLPRTPEEVLAAYSSGYNNKEPCLIIEDGRIYND